MASLLKKRSVPPRNPPRGTPPPPSRGTVKYVELYGTVAGGLGAGLSSNIIDYQVPDGHCAELFAVGVQPDFLAGASNLLDTEIANDAKRSGVKFLTNHLGKNALPYGDRLSKQPIRMLDFPMRPGNLTPKFNEGMKLQVVITAGAAPTVGTVRARAKILLYEPVDVATIFGCLISNFATLPGGVSQALPQILFTDYANAVTTTTLAKWFDAYTKAVKDYEQVVLSHIGVLPDGRSDALKLYDHRQKWEAPEYEPYFKILDVVNALPFGDDDDYQPTQKLPSPVSEHVYTNTDMKVQIRDDGAVASTASIMLYGTYRRLR